MEPLRWVFVMLSHSEINLHWYIALSLLDKGISHLFVVMSYDVKWRHLTCNLGSAVLTSTTFLKSQTENRKLIETQAIMLLNWANWWISGMWWIKLGKNAKWCQKFDFGQTRMKFRGCPGNVKNDGNTIGMSEFPRRMNEQVLKVPAPESNSSFLNFKEALWWFR